ncbi:MAG TPA: YceI family protein [Gemmatimonadaceae bacterium]|nr:YceI family protein [Gemmatimonadaceae bacterium]
MTAVAPITTTGTWQIDSAHTTAQFAVRHMMVATVKGSFNDVTGTATYNADGHVEVDVSIPVATIDTRNAQRDAHLRSPDFFDADKHPTISFKGKRIEGNVDGKFRLIGDLTMRGVTREIALHVTREGAGPDPYGNERMGFSATAKVNRHDFGLRWNMALEAGGVVVGDDVQISIDVELVRPLT